jgi:hypothetical protein
MKTKESAALALQNPYPIIEGRKANVNLAFLGAKPRGNSLQGMAHTHNVNYYSDQVRIT